MVVFGAALHADSKLHYGPLAGGLFGLGEVLTSSRFADSDRLIALDDVRKHASEGSCWIVYDGNVYDVTAFLAEHPGGKDTILGAGGQDLAKFWAHYQIHFESGKPDRPYPVSLKNHGFFPNDGSKKYES